MCGIFFSLSCQGHVFPNPKTEQLLRNRGPDSYDVHTVQLSNANGESHNKAPSVFLTFASSVLALRGGHIQSQPLVDPKTGSVLCWNGEAWKIKGDRVLDNDSKRVFKLLLDAVSPANEAEPNHDHEIARLASDFATISGPSAFVFYDAVRSRVIFGRDILGRRSLLHGKDMEGTFRLCSICDSTSLDSFEEVDTNGIHVIDLRPHRIIEDRPAVMDIRTVPWVHHSSPPEQETLPQQQMVRRLFN